jgi:hypothetical protein
LVAYYPFSSGSAQDASGNANHGTVNGATPTTDRFGNSNSAFSFDGSNDYINCGDSDSLDVTQGVTIAAWVNPLSTNDDWPTIVMKWSGNLSRELYGLYLYDKHIYGELSTTGEFINLETTEAPIVINEWQHLAMTFDSDSDTAIIYRNGESLQEWSDISGTILTSDYDLMIGMHKRGDYEDLHFHGSIDEVRIYDHALSPEEIRGLVPIPAAVWLLCSGLIGLVCIRRRFCK